MSLHLDMAQASKLHTWGYSHGHQLLEKQLASVRHMHLHKRGAVSVVAELWLHFVFKAMQQLLQRIETRATCSSQNTKALRRYCSGRHYHRKHTWTMPVVFLHAGQWN